MENKDPNKDLLHFEAQGFRYTGKYWQKVSLVGALFTGLTILIWGLFVAPNFLSLSSNFGYDADIVSIDNFYDEDSGSFLGEQRTVAHFSMEAVGHDDGVLSLKNVFDVKTPEGEPVVNIERVYGINTRNKKHVAGYGDKDRSGYLFAPQDLSKNDSFLYWHINYDAPAEMIFVAEEDFDGLTVYRYESRYKDQFIDQTDVLTHLPEVGITRGVILDPYLQIWVEPTTGRLIKFRDETIAYFYNLETGERISPWNKFSNSFRRVSIDEQVKLAKREKIFHSVIHHLIPLFILLSGLFVVLIMIYKRKKSYKLSGSLSLVGIVLFTLFAYLFSVYLEYNNIEVSSQAGSEPLKLVIAEGSQPAFAFIYIAESKGFFRDEGLDITYKPFTSGKQALDAVLRGDADLATVYETPIVLRGHEGEKFSIFTTLHRSDRNTAIVARVDRGIQTPFDLKGKSIAVTKETSGEFFLSLFLEDNRISIDDVQLIHTAPEHMAESLREGRVDAIATWNTHLFDAQRLFRGDELSVFFSASYTETSVLASLREWGEKNSLAIQKTLRALKRAEDTFLEDKREAQQITVDWLREQPATTIRAVWEDVDHELSLDYRLLDLFTLESEWMRGAGVVEGETPDFQSFIVTEFLEEVKPEGVRSLLK